MPSLVRAIGLAGMLGVGGAASVSAQRAVTLFVRGGSYSSPKSLNTQGTDDLKLGFNLGGGIGFQIDSTLELRASVLGAQSQLRRDGVATGAYLNRYFFGVDLRAQHPVAGARLYGLVGSGVVVLHEKGTSGVDKKQGFGHLGFGLAYPVRKQLAVFAQGDGFFYSLSQISGGDFLPYSVAEIDFGLSGGVTYSMRW